MDDGIAAELERAGRVHELLRMLRAAEAQKPRPRAGLDGRVSDD